MIALGSFAVVKPLWSIHVFGAPFTLTPLQFHGDVYVSKRWSPLATMRRRMLMKRFDILLYDRDANVYGVTAYIALALRCAAINRRGQTVEVW